MAEEKKPIEDIEAEDVEKHRRLDRKLSSQNPDRTEDYNRRADAKREKYARANYYESITDDDTERKARHL
jgi:hypothetical protein